MASPARVLMLELNEVPFRVLDEYCRRRPQGPLAALMRASDQYETWAEDSVLSPWITWPSVHRGVSDGRHGIRHLGQDVGAADRAHPTVWRLLSDAGVRCGVFGSLHTHPPPSDRERYAFYVPDAFAPSDECHPRAVAPFQSFNLAMSRRSARNVAASVSWRPALRMLARSARLGIRPSTLLAAARQLADERLRPWRRARRRTFQSELAFDVFLRLLRTRRPAFATFFTNHVASAMHRYWAAAFPGDYDSTAYDAGWRQRYGGEIDHAVSRAEVMAARLRAEVDRTASAELWIAGSMGQAATTAEPVATQLYVTDLPRFMAALGVPAGSWEARPAMAPDVSVFVAGTHADGFRERLRALAIGAARVEFDEAGAGFFAIRLGHVDGAFTSVTVGARSLGLQEAGLGHVAIEDGTNTNAYHVRSGSLLVYRSGRVEGAGERRRVSTLEIAPALVRRFGVAAPGYMAASGIACP